MRGDLSSNAPAGGYLDLNKNGRMDPYENPNLPVEQRIDNLLSLMTVNEKTCQMATLYGFGNVLKDDLPKPQWKNEVWKDGIANIDEQLNGWRSHREVSPNVWEPTNPNVWPASATRQGDQHHSTVVHRKCAAGHSRRFHQ